MKLGAGVGGGEGMLLGILGGGVPPCSPNPDPISDQKMSFSTPVFRPGSGCSNTIQRINYVLTFNTIQRIVLDSNLSWKFQINNVALKISRTVGQILYPRLNGRFC